MLRDLQARAEAVLAAGIGLSDSHKFLAFLLPAMIKGLQSMGLPSEAQLEQLLMSGGSQQLAAGAAAIIDAIAPIQNDERFDQVLPSRLKPSPSIKVITSSIVCL